jgi:hypothetical protein
LIDEGKKMLESFVEFLSEYSIGTYYLKIAVFLYIVCYVVEEVLGKYAKVVDKKRDFQ